MRTVCPYCGYSGALRLDHGIESARPTSSIHNGQRYCLRCQKWVLPIFPADFDRKYHAGTLCGFMVSGAVVAAK